LALALGLALAAPIIDGPSQLELGANDRSWSGGKEGALWGR
jgi:hypothetical protein